MSENQIDFAHVILCFDWVVRLEKSGVTWRPFSALWVVETKGWGDFSRARTQNQCDWRGKSDSLGGGGEGNYPPCYSSERLWVTHVKTHKLLQVCKQVVTHLFTSCRQVVVALLVPSCCNKFGTSLMALSDVFQGCSNKSDTVMI